VGVTVYVPTPNPTRGAQGNWWVGSKLAKQQREATALALASLAPVREAMAEGCIVTMTRVSAGTLDDDNLRPALKRIRDTVAVFLLGGKTGERDNDSRIVWLYEQAKGKRNCPAVDIEIRRRVA
jgi:hypothetical protein